MSDIILASGSASRRSILEGAGVPFRIVRPGVDEDALKQTLTDKTPSELSLALAEAKALSISEPGAFVIGSDQVLEFEGEAFDKPESKDELRDRLIAMSGKPHFLRGGTVVVKHGAVVERIQESSTLTMRDFAPEEIEFYLDAISDDVLRTVGGYEFEGLGARLFGNIEGDFFAILGLPLMPLLKVLRREGALSW